MLKLKKDLQKFVIVAGISIFLGQIAVNCFKTMFSIAKNQLFVEEEEEEEEEEEQEVDDEQELLTRLGEQQYLEEEKIRSIVKDLLNN